MPAKMKGKTKGKRSVVKRNRGLSRLRKPAEMSLEEWQVALRRDFGRTQKFRVKNLGAEPIFSEFEVANPETKRTYRVAIRGLALGENYCSCPDFAVNTLGTCKHIEHVLGRLERRPARKRPWPWDISRPTPRSICNTVRGGKWSFTRARIAPRPCGGWPTDTSTPRGCLKPESYARFNAFMQKAQSNGHEFRCYNDALGYIADVRDQAIVPSAWRRRFPGESAARPSRLF